ncbi:MAG: DUF2254 domain-containing protein [Acidimicrobiia bacterium]|nr:DUF2254 domain-containing protein [Acidimicrobiia bacterium]
MTWFQRLRERFWFVPAMICLAAAISAEVLIRIDRYGDGSMPRWVDELVYRVGESGSRDILGVIAASSLGVAGTTFSITMAVLALTSSSYGPRLVRNFMTDRGNQVVLGVYVATFLYSLLVLRSVRALGDPGDPDATVFIPYLAVNGAVLLAIANVGVLIYFIHHISNSIQISTIASRVRGDLYETVDRLYPDQIGRDASEVGEADDGTEATDVELPDHLDDRGVIVTAEGPGYVMFVRSDELFDAACSHDVLIALKVRPGDYVTEDQALAVVDSDRLDDGLEAAVRSSLVVGERRSPFHDIGFAVQQLIELAVRALSPGTNDPFTAINALDDLSSGLSRLAAREVPSPARFDADGVLRVHAPSADVADLVGAVLDHVRWYAAEHPSVVRAALELVSRVGAASRHRAVRARLLHQTELLKEAVGRADWQSHDVDDLIAAADEVKRGLARF